MTTMKNKPVKPKSKPKVKRKDGLKRQAQIMEISLDLFAEKGFHSTSLDDIIKKASIAKGTFYLHFEGKQDILDKILDFHLNKYFKYIKILDISLPIPIIAIKKIYIKMAKFISQSEDMKKFSKLILKEYPNFNHEQLAKFSIFFEKIIEMSERYITKAQKDGKLVKELDPKVAAITIVGAGKELLFRWAVLDIDFDVSSTVSQTLDLFFNGMLIRK